MNLPPRWNGGAAHYAVRGFGLQIIGLAEGSMPATTRSLLGGVAQNRNAGTLIRLSLDLKLKEAPRGAPSPFALSQRERGKVCPRVNA